MFRNPSIGGSHGPSYEARHARQAHPQAEVIENERIASRSACNAASRCIAAGSAASIYRLLPSDYAAP